MTNGEDQNSQHRTMDEIKQIIKRAKEKYGFVSSRSNHTEEEINRVWSQSVNKVNDVSGVIILDDYRAKSKEDYLELARKELREEAKNFTW